MWQATNRKRVTREHESRGLMVFTALTVNISAASNLNSMGENTKPNKVPGMSLVHTIE